jgi:hypothetical protein
MAAAPTTRQRLASVPRRAWEAAGPRAGEKGVAGPRAPLGRGGAKPAHDDRERRRGKS